MTQAAPATTRQMNRKERRQAAKKAKRGKRPGAGSFGGGMVDLVDPTIQKAAQFHRAGKLDRAEALYRDALNKTPDNPDALHLLGGLLATQGHCEEAIDRLTTARAIRPDDPKIHHNLALAYGAADRNDDAENSYRAALGLQPDYLESFKGLAIIREKLGDVSGALEQIQAALVYHPDDASLHKAAALFHQGQGRHSEALKHFKKAADLRPGDVEALMHLSISHRELGQVDQAASVLTESLNIDPDNQETKSRLALFLCDLGKPEPALLLALEAIREAPELPIAHSAFALTVQQAAFEDYRESFEEALCLAFDRDYCRHVEIGRAAVSTLRLKYNQVAADQQREHEQKGEASTGPQELRLDGIMTDGLLLRLLQSTKVPDPFFESFLTAIRRAVLRATPGQPTLSGSARRFLAILARHCHENSYAYFMADDERKAVGILKDSLRHEIDRLPASKSVVETRLALIALYEPLIVLPEAAELGQHDLDFWSEEVRDLFKATLHNPLKELTLRQSIVSLTEIDDETSKKVQAQYESNPYPRWWHSQDPTSLPFVRALKLEVPHFEGPAFLRDPVEILVAGCGTGQHPISIASYIQNCDILAIDLSRTSLAYAMRMAEEVGIENITFRHGDILSLSCLDRQFPVIECAGVLHHMKDPEAGLSTLVDLLRPQGLMKLGLYSEIARANIVEARDRIAALGLSSDADDIRAFRRKILKQEPGYEPLAGLLSSNDFYDLDGTRDLLFHVQEHRYTIPQLADMLQRHGLRFIGFCFSTASTKRAYAERFPEDPDMTDLSLWQIFEEENPHTFVAMYQFWCQKVA